MSKLEHNAQMQLGCIGKMLLGNFESLNDILQDAIKEAQASGAEAPSIDPNLTKIYLAVTLKNGATLHLTGSITSINMQPDSTIFVRFKDDLNMQPDSTYAFKLSDVVSYQSLDVVAHEARLATLHAQADADNAARTAAEGPIEGAATPGATATEVVATPTEETATVATPAEETVVNESTDK